MIRKGHNVSYGSKLTDKFVMGHPEACWRWLGGINSSGYGQVRVGGQVIGAHIAVYDALADSLGLPPRPRDRDARGKLGKSSITPVTATGA